MMFHIAGSVVRVDCRELQRIFIEDVQEKKAVEGGFLCNYIVKKLREYWGDELQLDESDAKLHSSVENSVIAALRHVFGRDSIKSCLAGVDKSFSDDENTSMLNLGLKLVGENCTVASFDACLNGCEECGGYTGGYTDDGQHIRAINRIGMIEVLLLSGVDEIQFLLN